jgi:hypothetical protein
MQTDREPDQRIALEKYRNIIGYLQYENQTYWTRLGFVFAIQIGLVAFGSRVIVESLACSTLTSQVASTWISVLGVLICAVGFQMIRGAKLWIARWEDALVAIEPDAYGEQQIFRNAHRDLDRKSGFGLRELAAVILCLFLVTWGVALAAVWTYTPHCKSDNTCKSAA